jgi:N-formylmaleamate deformylase
MPLETYLDPIRWARSGAGTGDLRTLFPTLSDDELALRAAWLPTCDEEAVAETYRGFHEDDFFAWWRELRAPVLFLWGGASAVVTADDIPDLAAGNPAASVVCLPDAGHMLPWDDLDGFLAAIRGFDG